MKLKFQKKLKSSLLGQTIYNPTFRQHADCYMLKDVKLGIWKAFEHIQLYIIIICISMYILYIRTYMHITTSIRPSIHPEKSVSV